VRSGWGADFSSDSDSPGLHETRSGEPLAAKHAGFRMNWPFVVKKTPESRPMIVDLP
jgi:hypothetical protein